MSELDYDWTEENCEDERFKAHDSNHSLPVDGCIFCEYVDTPDDVHEETCTGKD